MKSKQTIPNREIGEDESELLEQLWSRVADVPGVEQVSLHEDFEELQRRIRCQRRRKRSIHLTMTGGLVAAVVVGYLFWFHFPSQPMPAPTAIEQLHEMGVKIDNHQVVLKMDNEKCVSLDSAASIERTCDNVLSLRTAKGEKLALADTRMLRLEVPAGRHFHITLSDGTRVWLNASSSLEYPASFDGKTERRVKLAGEAFFEVSRDEHIPFYVETGSAESIQVLGTSFNVNAYPESEKHVTTLVSGKISYSSGIETEKIILTPNQQVRLNCHNGRTEVAHVDASSFIAWRDGWIYFEDESLETLALRLSRLYGIQIEVDARLKTYAFSGKISVERGVDYITRLMTETTGIVCQVEDGIIRLK